MAERCADYVKSSNLSRKAVAIARRRLETLRRAAEAFDPIDGSETTEYSAFHNYHLCLNSPSDLVPAPKVARRQCESQPQSAQSPTTCCPCESRLREILKQLEVIKEQQKKLLVHLQSRTSAAAEQLDVSEFPLATLDDLDQMETRLSDTEYKERLVTYFGLVGGFSVRETVWRVLTKMISNSLAKTMNWTGVNGKTGFESLALKNVVLKSVRLNTATATASDGETERFIKRWLQLASDREGGRRQRALRQAASEQP